MSKFLKNSKFLSCLVTPLVAVNFCSCSDKQLDSTAEWLKTNVSIHEESSKPQPGADSSGPTRPTIEVQESKPGNKAVAPQEPTMKELELPLHAPAKSSSEPVAAMLPNTGQAKTPPSQEELAEQWRKLVTESETAFEDERYHIAISNLENAVSLTDKLEGEDKYELKLVSLNLLAQAFLNTNQTAQSTAILANAMDLIGQTSPRLDLELETRIILASVLNHDQKFAESEKFAREVISKLEPLDEANAEYFPYYQSAVELLAVAREGLDDPEGAKFLYEQLVAIQNEFDPEPNALSKYLGAIATVAFELGLTEEVDEALAGIADIQEHSPLAPESLAFVQSVIDFCQSTSSNQVLPKEAGVARRMSDSEMRKLFCIENQNLKNLWDHDWKEVQQQIFQRMLDYQLEYQLMNSQRLAQLASIRVHNQLRKKTGGNFAAMGGLHLQPHAPMQPTYQMHAMYGYETKFNRDRDYLIASLKGN